jgi:hypothetical protein
VMSVPKHFNNHTDIKFEISWPLNMDLSVKLLHLWFISDKYNTITYFCHVHLHFWWVDKSFNHFDHHSNPICIFQDEDDIICECLNYKVNSIFCWAHKHFTSSTFCSHCLQ